MKQTLINFVMQRENLQDAMALAESPETTLRQGIRENENTK